MGASLAAFLKWWAALLMLGAAAWPLVFYLFRKLPDRGLSFSRPLGLLLSGYLFWLGASFGFWTNSAGSAATAAAAVLAVGTVACVRAGLRPWSWLARNRRLALGQEGIFLATFALWAWVRANNPGAVATEKPMELAFLNSILRSTTFPPRDPWLSGYAISYYYFGYVLVGMLAKLAYQSGAYAFNLGVSSWYALTALAAFGLLSNLLSLREPAGAPGRDRLRWAGLLAPFALLWVGNLEGVLEVFYNLRAGWIGRSGPFWQWLDIPDLASPPSTPATLDPAGYRFWWWWRASRVIQDRDLLGRSLSLQPIDEFPSFSFMLGDLHPHVLALPFGLAVLGLGLELFLRIRSSTAGSAAGPDLNAQFPLSWIGFASLALGGLAFLNTWDFPIYLLVCATATWLAWRGGTRAGWRGLVGRWAVVIALGILLYLPFYLTFSSQAAGVLPNLIFVTKGQQFAVMFGPLLLPIVLWMIALAASQRRRPMWAQGACLAALVPIILFLCSLGLGILLWQNPFAAQLVRSLIQPMTVGQALVALLERRLLMLGTLIALGVILGLSLAVLLPTLRERSPQAAASPAFPPAGRSHSMGVVPLSAAESFVLLLVAGGVILALVPEFVYLRDQFGTRMNTIFKFYFQAWTLWSLAAAYGLASLWRWSRAHGRSDSTAGNWAPKVLGGRLGAWIASAGLLLGFVYTPLSVWTKTSGFGLGTSATLDASAHLSSDDPDDAQAIAWMNANLRDGTLVEAVGGEYSDFARISTYTGIPTVLGWAGHEAQWRGGYNEVGSREEDIAQLYRTEDWATALRLIQRYQIEYIYFGPLEIQTYGTQGLAKFQAHLHVAYQGGSATLFEAEPAPPAGVS